MKNTLFIFITLILNCSSVFGQVNNFDGINIQGQFNQLDRSEIGLVFTVLTISEDTVWQENHSDVIFSSLLSFDLTLGKGERISGIEENFKDIDWYSVESIKLSQYYDGENHLLGTFFIWSQPYAFHSLSTDFIPATNQLIDAEIEDVSFGHVLFYSETGFKNGLVRFNDSTYYSFESDSAVFADSVLTAYHYLSDSSHYAIEIDTVNIAGEVDFAKNADSVLFADTVNISDFSVGNWSLLGDSLFEEDKYIGPDLLEDLDLYTNGYARFTIGEKGFRDNALNEGLNISASQGFLANGLGSYTTEMIEALHLNYMSEKYSFSGGNIPFGLDSSVANYSFVWGDSVRTTGAYSVIIGKNTIGDSVVNYGVNYGADYSVGIGRNVSVGRICFAFGDSAIADFYRNVAIGKNVHAGGASAAIAIGRNIESIGATTWAMGQNLTINGSFSSGLGYSASSDRTIGSFIYGDYSTSDTVKNTMNNQFMVRASGGVVFYTSIDLSMGVELLAGGGSWEMVSDRTKKEHITKLNPLSYHAKLAALPIYTWFYKNKSTMHLGPMAQDFYSLFEVGETPLYINMIDADGITFLGIKMLNEELQELPTENDVEAVKMNTKILSKEFKAIEERLNELYEKLD